MPLVPHTTFDHYEILAPLGKGGMGEVYAARDTRLNREVALKVLPASFAQDIDRLRRFEQEALATSALNHPNILTVHDFGLHDNAPFIVAELLNGYELRVALKRGVLPLALALEYGQQIAQGLAAAHAKGIIHRDLKPENLFVTTEGVVKVLDFGLAKLAPLRNADRGRRIEEAETLQNADFGQRSASNWNEDAETLVQAGQDNPQSAIPNPQSPISNPQSTMPGIVMGTAGYMSPEQARGERVDARSDLFSLGIVIYEMIVGRQPFTGVNMLDVIGAILHQEPAPMVDAPAEVQRIVTKALQKDRAARYQTAQELALDLKELKDELAYQARAARTSSETTNATLLQAPTETAQAEAQASRVPPSGGDAGDQALRTLDTRRHRLRFSLIAVVALILIAAAFFYFKRSPALTDKDTILLADFTNTTNDPVFDGTLKQALAVHLGQSPFLNLFADERVRETLRLMNKSPDERITPTIGREICQRQGLKAMLTGTIASLGRNYVISLEAVNGQTGDVLAREQGEAEGKEQVLRSLGEAATRLRGKLGESLSSIQKFDVPLEATTSSLEALQAFSQAWEQRLKGDWLRAIPPFQRAIEIDPNFAFAYSGLASMYSNTYQTGLAIEAATKAYTLKDRVSEHERLMITRDYTDFVTGELTKSIETLERLKQLYPRDHRNYTSLAADYRQIGQFENAKEASRLAIQLNPNAAAAHINLGWAEIPLNHFAEAKETFEKSLEQKLDSIDIHDGLYRIAFVAGDTAAMQKQLDWATGTPAEHFAFGMQTHTAAFAGQWRKAQEFSQRAFALATKEDAKGTAATYALARTLLAAALNKPAVVKTSAQECLAIERSNWTLPRIALAFALTGSQTQTLVDEIIKRYPKDTLINGLWLPTINAALELQRGNAQTAVTMLEAAKRYEPAAEFWPQYVRGLAYLKLNQAPAAAIEFQKIIDHRGEAPLSLLWSLAHLGLARAAMLQGDPAKAQKSYQDFFALWKDADADLPVLLEAKKEYEKVK